MPQQVSAFYFIWPWMLLLLGLIPLWWLLYLRAQRQRLRQLALQFSYTAVASQIQRQPAAWKRLRFPVGVSVLMACLVVALARPTVVARVPVTSIDMMLVMDISLSMLAEDMQPDRISAAKEAAIRFVDSLPREARIGLEVFAGDNYVLSPPTRDHEEIKAYLKALKREDLKPRTEIGSALHTALQVLETATEASAPAGLTGDTAPDGPQSPPPKADRVIVLMSDGDSQEGYPWSLAVQEARSDNVTIHTVGIGSEQGTFIIYQGLELPVTFNETTLRQIADMAGGSYFRVFRPEDFRQVYEQIRERTIHYEQQSIDLAFLLAGFGLLILLAGTLAGGWSRTS